jgi:CBS domain-containing protein
MSFFSLQIFIKLFFFI